MNRLCATSISGNYIEEFGSAGGNTTWYGIRATVQGGAASTISGNRVFHFTPERAGTRYTYIALTHVNYGIGDVTVTGNAIRGAGQAADTGFSYAAGSGVTLNVASSGNLVASVHTARTIGPGVRLSADVAAGIWAAGI